MAYYCSINKMCEHSSVVEHHVANVIVAGSIPVTRSIFCALVAQPVEQMTLNHWVQGSNPCERTIFLLTFRLCPRLRRLPHVYAQNA